MIIDKFNSLIYKPIQNCDCGLTGGCEKCNILLMAELEEEQQELANWRRRTVGELLKKINSFEDKEKLKTWLKEIKMTECYYQNEVDDLIAYKLNGKVPEKFKSATEFLRGIGCDI